MAAFAVVVVAVVAAYAHTVPNVRQNNIVIMRTSCANLLFFMVSFPPVLKIFIPGDNYSIALIFLQYNV